MSRAWRALTRNRLTMIGLGLMGLFLLLAIVGPYVAPYDPIHTDLKIPLAPPSRAHWFGTDSLGRDVASRVLAGARYSVPTGFAVVAAAMLVGLLVGALAGFLGGWVDEALMRITDLFLAFPSLILAMAIAGALGPSLPNALAAISITWWPAYARLVRAEVMKVRTAQYVEAARALGVPGGAILVRHILPNCMAPVVVQATLDLGSVILTAAGLSFIGFGAQPPTPEWGAMINDGRVYMASHPWVVAFPGAAIFLCVMGFNLLGDGLRDALDPRSARSGA
jgi:peptide/nickel transport system permease protein